MLFRSSTAWPFPTAGGAGAGRGSGSAVLVLRRDLVACGEWFLRSSSTLEVVLLPAGLRFALFYSGVRRRGRASVVQQFAAVVLCAECFLYDSASVLAVCILWL